MLNFIRSVRYAQIPWAGNENLKILQAGNPPVSRRAFSESILLLTRNLTPRGIVAASATPESAARNYTRVFCRDACISSMGMAVSGDPLLRGGAMAGLEFLASRQAENGQIPNFVAPETGESDFWYLGCIDATLWWLAAAYILAERSLERTLFGAPEVAPPPHGGSRGA